MFFYWIAVPSMHTLLLKLYYNTHQTVDINTRKRLGQRSICCLKIMEAITVLAKDLCASVKSLARIFCDLYLEWGGGSRAGADLPEIITLTL